MSQEDEMGVLGGQQRTVLTGVDRATSTLMPARRSFGPRMFANTGQVICYQMGTGRDGLVSLV